MEELIKLTEPPLLFGHGQAMEDPRDGLSLFGPLDEGKTYGISNWRSRDERRTSQI